MIDRFVTGVVLAAGSSRRLGRPKQLLPFGDATLLDATLRRARQCGFDQLLVTLGASAAEVRATVDLSGATAIDSPAPEEGCASSIAAAVGAIDAQADGLVVLLGDQPGVRRDDVWRLVEQGSGHPVAVSRYAAPAAGPHQGDTRGHPFWFARSTFADLERLHGDKAIWKLLESGRHPVAEVAMEGAVPLDVDTWEDYERLLAVGEATTSWRER